MAATAANEQRQYRGRAIGAKIALCSVSCQFGVNLDNYSNIMICSGYVNEKSDSCVRAHILSLGPRYPGCCFAVMTRAERDAGAAYGRKTRR
jgi:hypothetical protein